MSQSLLKHLRRRRRKCCRMDLNSLLKMIKRTEFLKEKLRDSGRELHFGDFDSNQDQAEEMNIELGLEGLGEASSLDTTQDLDFESPSGWPQPDISSYHVVVKRAAELLGLPLTTKLALSEPVLAV